MRRGATDRRENDRDRVLLLRELLTHDERNYGRWTSGMRDRVRNVLAGRKNVR